MKKNVVITIGREFGSGGKYIGQMVAKKLNIPFYDKELIVKISEKNGYNYSKLEEHDELKKNSSFYPIDYLDSNDYTKVFSDDIYQSLMDKTIKEVSHSSCVILGRNSNNVLKDKSNVINIFIYSNDMEFKIKRKMFALNVTNEEALKQIKTVDKQRRKYYENLNKTNSWGNIRDYDLCIDSSLLGVDKTVDLIVDIYNKYKES